MQKCGIYKIVSPDNKVYVGQSKDIYTRWKSYKNLKNVRGQRRVYKSFKKYGADNHKFEIIEECEEEELRIKERYWQDYHNVISDKGLNCKLEECEGKPRIECEETKKLRSISSSGENNGMYGRSRELNPNYGVKMSDEQKQYMSNTMKGRYDGELNPFYGKNHSEETISILSNLAKERIGDKNSFYGKNHTEEYKKRSSENKKKFYKDNPNSKQYLRELLSRGKYHTPKGIFLSQREACKANGISICCIKNRCINNSDKKVGYNYNIPKEFQGEETWREKGWYFIPND